MPAERRHHSLTETGWAEPSSSVLPPEGDAVHVWRYRVDDGSVPMEAACLSPDERRRAGRFRFERDRRTYAQARTVLRRLISSYLGGPAAAVQFSYGTYGKPALTGPTPEITLQFNLAHAGAYVVYAFSAGRPVGIDLEPEDETVVGELLAGRFFSARELADLTALPDTERTAAVYRTWTRKEAYIKAEGGGLSVPLDQFSVTVAPRQAPAIDQAGYALASFMVDEFLPGALVRHGPIGRVGYFDVPLSLSGLRAR